MTRYNVIGTMSGTSLDGLDVAYCTFELNEQQHWSFKINAAATIHFPTALKEKLISAIQLTGFEIMLMHNELGNFTGKSINDFIQQKAIDKAQINAISSHGHTVFHQPNINLTAQIGNGANIAALTQLPVICDFRTTDVALNGQGAPLVPIGDQMLFSNYDYCINLGGIANVSFRENEQRIAFDICPVNIVLNRLAQQLGKDFDEGGILAQSGVIDSILLEKLNQLSYYEKLPPKSLGIEWITNNVFPIIDASNIATKDKLRTFVEHIAFQIGNTIKSKEKTILMSGGGAYNTFLAESIQSHSNNKIIIPSNEIIEYKEALIFAFLGVLRLRKEVNCLQSVTGALKNNIGGCIYQAF